MATADIDAGVIVLPKKLSLGVAIGFVLQLVAGVAYVATTQATATGRIERLEKDGARDGSTLADINGRTIRMEVELAYIKMAIDRVAKR